MRVTLLTNGPGELWGWVRPVAMELRRRGHSVSLWLLPCPFASGHEREAASLLGVDKLEGPAGAKTLWDALPQERTDCAVQLGGDLMFGSRLARAAKVPLLCYAYGPKKGMRGAEMFTAFPAQAAGIPDSRVIGDLVKDALDMDEPAGHGGAACWAPEGGSPRVLFLPGSRPAIRRAVLPWFAAIEAQLRAEFPGMQARTLFPPFIPEAELVPWREAGLGPVRCGAAPAMRGADFALTQPGTNNFELMHCGLPALAAAPSAFLDLAPVSGLRGMLASLPLLGRRIRLAALQRVLRRHGGFISLPNRLAGRRVMDEMYGDITPQQIAGRAAAILRASGDLGKMREELLALSGRAGAAGRLCDAIERAVDLPGLPRHE